MGYDWLERQDYRDVYTKEEFNLKGRTILNRQEREGGEEEESGNGQERNSYTFTIFRLSQSNAGRPCGMRDGRVATLIPAFNRPPAEDTYILRCQILASQII